MNLELTHENHFKYFYNEVPFGFRKSAEDVFSVSYGKARKHLNFSQACEEQSRLIYSKAGHRVGILLSGGVDSEVALQSFVRQGLPVKAYIGKMRNDYNLHDMSYAVIACERMLVPYQIIDYDFEKMMDEQGYGYAELSQCFSPQLIAVMYLMDQISEYVVVGGGDCILVPGSGNEWFLRERERVTSWYKFLQRRHRESCVGFFQYTPEVIHAYVRDPLVQMKIRAKSDYESSADFKLEFYQQYFDLIKRKKMTGFEKIQDLDYRYRSELQKIYGHCDQEYNTAVTKFVTA
ncbi:MAG: hypothetical protein HUU57_04765 [Bdellovibrio sp.]|nr:hypothetical protein [Bdellovibrio sp.]